ncbi:MAG: ribonuclease Z [Rhizomicrobium sp.]
MRPLFHASLVNGRFGDPALYVETQFEARAVLFDLGDIVALPPRKIQRIERVFVSHTHIDHFIGFDHLLRLSVGREKTIRLYGPEGFIESVHHKLRAYNWNLASQYKCDLVLDVSEITQALERRCARFRLKTAFAREDAGADSAANGIIVNEPNFRVSIAVLEHRVPSIGYALKEVTHVNVWKTRLAALDLPAGPWLRAFKHAILAGKENDYPIAVPGGMTRPLGTLREAATVTDGQKIGYIADAAGTASNQQAIAALVHDADLLFIEACFAETDAALAAERAHLTTRQAGEIARAAHARRVEPFHFSPRYTGEEARMLDEVARAFAGPGANE